MQSIGRKDTIRTAGADRPTPGTATMKPRVAARLYAGAVDAVAITMFDAYEIALDFRPFSPGAEPGTSRRAAGSATAVIRAPPGRAGPTPRRRRWRRSW